MRTIELPLFRQEVPVERMRRSVRVIGVAQKSADAIILELQEKDVKDISFVEVVLGKKPPTGPSANNLIAFGGGIEPGESPEEAAIREFGHESTILALNTQQTMQEWKTAINEGRILPFTYKPPGRPKSEVYFVVLPVAGQDKQKYGIRGMPGDNMESVIVLSQKEFETLIETGEINGAKIVGHMSKRTSDHIRISKTNKNIKNKELTRVVEEVAQFERQLRVQTLHEVNSIRQIRRVPHARDLSECDPTELHAAYIAAQMRLDMSWERNQEHNIAKAIRQGSDTDTLVRASPVTAQDPLKVAPYLSRENILEHPELLLSLPTRELIHKANILKNAVKQTLRSASYVYNGTDVFANLPWSNGFMHVIGSVQERLKALSVDTRADVIMSLDGGMAESFARLMGVPKEMVVEAVIEGGDLLFNEITTSLKRKYGGFQEHLAANEIGHSGLFGYVLLALRIHPDLMQPLNDAVEVTKKIQYEAIRELGLLFPEVGAIKEWHESNIDKVIDILIVEFFGIQQEKEEIEIEVDGKMVPHTVYHRRADIEIQGIRPHVIIDDRPKKSKVGLIRKSLLENGPIRDNRATSVVLSDDNFSEKLPLESRLQFAETLRDEMLQFFINKLGAGWTIQVEWDAEDLRYKNAREYAAIADGERLGYIRELIRVGGKRPGSQGYRFIRDQFRIILEKDGKILKREMDFYPIEDTHNENTPEEIRNADQYWKELNPESDPSDNVFVWGWRQKLRDHSQGNYEAARYYSRSSRWHTEPSLYELLWSSLYYYFLIERVRSHQVK